MSNCKNFTTLDEVAAATKEVVDSLETRCSGCEFELWEKRWETQKPQCKFGLEGVCCRLCGMGPCRITPKAPRGICGVDAAGIVGRNVLRMVASGTASHSDHGRHIGHVLHAVSRDGPWKITDEQKLLDLAAEWDVKTEGRDIYDIAHEVALIGLDDYGKPFGTARYLSRATKERQDLWERENIAPRAIDREIATCMHMTHMGNSTEPVALLRQALRTGMADGYVGSMMATDFSDILFGTPVERTSEANLGCIEVDQVNIVVHGHDPCMSEMIVLAAEQPDILEYARSKGAKGINITGICCTSNEVLMRHGVRISASFLQQEHVLLTGAIEAMVVDVQCVFPSIAPISQCFHTKFITTSEICQIPGAIHIQIDDKKAFDQAREIVRMACDAYSNRDPNKVFIPDIKHHGTVGFSLETILKKLDGVTNSFVDERQTYKPLIDCIKSGVLRGAVAMAGCNNPKIPTAYGHIEIMKECIKNDIIVIASGCAAQSALKAGLLSKEAKDLCGAGLKRVCELADIPPVLHMGACVDISRMMLLANRIAMDWDIDVPQVPVVACAAEWMSEKAVAIGHYVVSTGIDTFLGVSPPVKGSVVYDKLLSEGVKDITGATFTVEEDPDKLVKAIIDRIEEKRKELGLDD
ncbi:MAG: anaerobic carbon-monoxide dehydrogenase catalytic subunit [Oscillospiraceae bacterium]|jgi:carbon-monoxide dehydrogenase catalytic subunit|nr:anaerobic carbon-monoxide dehydrogenase catalytic subunit [Oscillospiraceae bacterium]